MPPKFLAFYVSLCAFKFIPLYEISSNNIFAALTTFLHTSVAMPLKFNDNVEV